MIWVGIYLVAGLVALALFDLLTGRVRSQLKRASYDTQDKLASTNNVNILVGFKMAKVIILILLWVFWPFVFLGAFLELVSKGGDDEKRTK